MIIDKNTPGVSGLLVYLNNGMPARVCRIDTDAAAVEVELQGKNPDGTNGDTPWVSGFNTDAARIPSVRLAGVLHLKWNPKFGEVTPQLKDVLDRDFHPPKPAAHVEGQLTVYELIEWLNEQEVPGHFKVRVAAFGGMRSGKEVDHAMIGFDWDQNCVVLYTKLPLAIKSDAVTGWGNPTEQASQLFMNLVCDGGTPSIDCQLCGRTHFASGPSSDEPDEEVKRLRQLATEQPSKYCESTNDSIGYGHIDGKQVAWDCPCRRLRRYEDFIWSHRALILAYLKARAAKNLQDATALNEAATTTPT
jgi:hypothetical protein